METLLCTENYEHIDVVKLLPRKSYFAGPFWP